MAVVVAYANYANTEPHRTAMPNTTDPLLDASIETLQAAMAAGDLSSVQLTEYYLARITEHNRTLNAIQTVNDNALQQAAQMDVERVQKGPRSPLHGLPVLVKDNYETKDAPTTAGSILFQDFYPQRDATLVRKLRDAGAVILGKTTMHEFAYGITTVGSAFGAARNPYDKDRNPGGSSGGSGAAVAANLSTFAMGSDTCGSIRIPAAHNNLVGLRGTQGLLSRHGIVPLSNTQDIGGPLARSVKDLAIVLDATVGYDADDEQTRVVKNHAVGEYREHLRLHGSARVGVLRDWLMQEPADGAVAQVVSSALQKLSEVQGWHVQSLASPDVNAALDRRWNGHYVLIYDFKQDLNTYLAANPSLGIADLGELVTRKQHHPDIEPSLMASLAANDATAYAEELAQREVVRNALRALLQKHDLHALAYPTIRQVAAPVGTEQMGTNCRLAANSGLPAITVPAGFDANGLPVGLELLGDTFSEQTLLDLAYTVETTLNARRLP